MCPFQINSDPVKRNEYYEEVMARIPSRFRARFSMRPSGCWEWTGVKSRSGYGRLPVGRKNLMAHRVSFFLSRGEWPKNLVCHKCDNRLCVRPSHLFEGTHKDNFEDCRSKGRVGMWRHYLVKKTHCPRGHEYTAENVEPQNGACKECNRIRARNRWRRIHWGIRHD